MRNLIIFLASGIYTGFSPVASGTVGTLVGIALFIPFMFLSPLTYLLALLVLTAFSCWIAGKAEEIFHEKDSGKIVIDEIVGYLFTMIWIPISWGSSQEILTDFLPKVIAGFFLFRLTDIFKPPPARWIDKKMQGGTGVVLDDVVAGIYANLLLRALLYLWTNVF